MGKGQHPYLRKRLCPSKPNRERGTRQKSSFPRLDVRKQTAGERLPRLGAQGWEVEGGSCAPGRLQSQSETWQKGHLDRGFTGERL